MNRIADIATYAFVVAGILVLTRPGSKGPEFVASIGHALTQLTQGASGQTVTKY